MRVIGVIPARLASTRLPEKVLRNINGRPMIRHVWEKATQAKELDQVIVACDDPKVEAAVRDFGGEAVRTRPDHPNGSSRIAEIAARENADILINIQGDEPMIRPEGIDLLAAALKQDPAVSVATLAVRRRDRDDYENPNVVKVVCDENGNALYFSRSPLPHFREKAGSSFSYLKHLGIYGYRREFLLQFVTWPEGNLENREKLEQLRILEKGVPIRVLETSYDSLSVDTEEDLLMVERMMTEAEKK